MTPDAVSGAATDPYALAMQAFQNGDTASFAILVERYRGPIASYLYRCVRDRASAEELAQEVFLRVFLTRNYRPTAKFQTWLFRIATNLAINWVRDHRVESQFRRLDDTPPGRRAYEPSARGRSIEEELVLHSRLAEVRSAIDLLPPRARAAVLMHKYEEMEYQEISQALECSVPALKSLLFRAYEILRERLAHMDYDDSGRLKFQSPPNSAPARRLSSPESRPRQFSSAPT